MSSTNQTICYRSLSLNIIPRIAGLPVGTHSLDRHPAIELLLIGIENFLYAEAEIVRFHLAVLETAVDIVARRGPADDVLTVEFVEFVKVFLWGGRKERLTVGLLYSSDQ